MIFRFIKKLFLLTVAMLVMVGAYAFGKQLMSLDIFTVRKVEVFGVINSDKAHINNVANLLVGKNIFDKSIKSVVINDEPWVQKVVARRQLPDKITIYVYEEQVLFDYQVGDSCYSYTANDISIKRLCNAPKIFADKPLTKKVARKFYNIAKDEDYFATAVIDILDYKYKVYVGGGELIFPYDKEIANKNYGIYKSALLKRYKTIEYIDMTVVDRIFVKGVLNGSSKG